MTCRGDTLQDRAERLLARLNHGPPGSVQREAIHFIRELLVTVYRLEQERDDLLEGRFPIQ